MRQDLDLKARREAKKRIESLLSYYLPELGAEHAFCRILADELKCMGAELLLVA